MGRFPAHVTQSPKSNYSKNAYDTICKARRFVLSSPQSNTASTLAKGPLCHLLYVTRTIQMAKSSQSLLTYDIQTPDSPTF